MKAYASSTRISSLRADAMACSCSSKTNANVSPNSSSLYTPISRNNAPKSAESSISDMTLPIIDQAASSLTPLKVLNPPMLLQPSPVLTSAKSRPQPSDYDNLSEHTEGSCEPRSNHLSGTIDLIDNNRVGCLSSTCASSSDAESLNSLQSPSLMHLPSKGKPHSLSLTSLEGSLDISNDSNYAHSSFEEPNSFLKPYTDVASKESHHDGENKSISELRTQKLSFNEEPVVGVEYLPVDSSITEKLPTGQSEARRWELQDCSVSSHDTEEMNCSVWKEIPNTTLVLHQPPPHFLAIRETIFKEFQNKKIYLFLDYDGTLTPIVSNPWEATLSPVVRELLYNLAGSTNKMVTIGIVTGRALASVKQFVQITASEKLNFIYAASHGFHIEAAGKMLHHRVGSRFIPILKAAAREVALALSHIPGVTLEDNEFAVSVHYRNAAVGAECLVESIVDCILCSYPTLRKTRGKMVFELRINVAWDKGRAVNWLLKAMSVNPYEDQTRVIYIGDDLTDEDAFRAVRQFENSLTILVSSEPEKRLTAASHFVETPSEVADILRDLLKIVESDSPCS